MHENIDFYWNEYSSLKDWIIFSDAKAGAIIVFNGIIVNLLLPKAIEVFNFQDIFDLNNLIIVIPGGLVALSTISALWSYLPDSTVSQPNSLIYYKEIQKKYPRVEQYIRAVLDEYRDSNKMEIDLLGQIWALAHVAQRKYFHVNRSFCLLMSAIGLGAIGLCTKIFGSAPGCN